MTESTIITSQKLWKRILIGGLISLIASNILPSIGTIPNLPFSIALPFYFLALVFVTPADLLLLWGVDEIDPLGIYLLTIFFFWFIVGALIAAVEKNTKRAIGWWVLLVIIFALIRVIFGDFG